MLGERALGAWDNVEIHQCSKKALEISATEQPSKFLKTHSARQAPGIPSEELLTKFREFLKVDLRRSDKTAYEHTYYIKKFLNSLRMPVETATSDDVREYLKSLKTVSSAQYKKRALCTLFDNSLRRLQIDTSSASEFGESQTFLFLVCTYRL